MSKTQIVAPAGQPQIEIVRSFAAPRELIFRAFTAPDMLVQWMGPRRMGMEIDTYEVRDGGRWRFVHRDETGQEFGFRGVFHGTPSPDATVRTFEFEGAPGHVSLETLTLEERNGETLTRQSTVFQSVADRDAMLASGMEQGVEESLERLEELLARAMGDG